MAIKQIGSLREYYRQGDNTGAPASPVGMGHAQAIQPVEGFAGSVLGRLPEMGRLVEPLARGYREAQTERVDNELLRVEREFTEWKDEWQTKNQGADARDAAAAFTAKHEELGKAALERMDDIGDHEIFKDLLTKRLNHQNLYALRDGLSYARREGEAFSQGQWQGQLGTLKRMAEEHPEDNQALAFEANNALASYAAKNPGKDLTAVSLQMEDMIRTAQIETLLSQGRMEEAKAALAQGLAGNVSKSHNGAALGLGGVHRGQAGRGHSIAEDLCNPLNLKKVGHNGHARTDFQSFASDGEGMRASWKQLKIYQHGKRALKTPRQMIAIWAPESDGNRHSDYIACVRKFGVNVDEPIDIDDIDQAAKLIKGMAVMESPLGARYSNEQIKAMLLGKDEPAGAAGAAGSGNGALGISPLKAARWQAQIDAAEQRKEASADAGLKGALDDYFAKCRDGLVVDPPFSEAEILQKYAEKGPALWARINDEHNFAIAASQISGLDTRAQDALLESLTPLSDDPAYKLHKDLADNLGRMIEKDRRERAKDPVSYILKYDKETAQAWKAFCENPSPETFAPYISELRTAKQVRAMHAPEGTAEPVISQFGAAELARQINQSDNPVAAMRQFESAAGRHAKDVMEQVLPKLGPTAMLLSGGVAEDVGQAIMQARKNPNFQKEADEQLGTDFDRKLFDEDIADALKEITSTFARQGNISMARAIRENTQIYAKHLILAQGLSQKDAIKKAVAAVINERYQVEESPSGSPYRIPKHPDIDPDQIPGYLEDWLAKMDLTKIDVAIPGGQKPQGYLRLFRQNLKANASFVTSEDESGVYLFIGSRALKSKDGTPVRITWQELASLYKPRPVPVPKGENFFSYDFTEDDY